MKIKVNRQPMLFLSQGPMGFYTTPPCRHIRLRMHSITAVHQYAGIQHPGLIAQTMFAKQTIIICGAWQPVAAPLSRPN
jgi:hypothetical protein